MAHVIVLLPQNVRKTLFGKTTSFELASAFTRDRASLCSSLTLDVTCWNGRGWNQREGAEEGDNKVRANKTPPGRLLPSQAKTKRGVATQETSKAKA